MAELTDEQIDAALSQALDDDYTHRVEQAIYDGIREACIDAQSGSVMLRGDLVALAMIDCLSVFLAPSPRCATFRERRETVEQLSKRLGNNLKALQEERAKQAGALILKP